MMSYILVTGGAGYIGSCFVNYLLDIGKKNIIVIDNLSTGKKFLLNKNVKFFKLDIKNLIGLRSKLKSFKIDTIFHFAACLSVPESEKNPKKYYMNNVIGTENILKISIEKKINKIIFSSTCAVYAELQKMKKVNETSPLIPKSNYGKTKLLAEYLIKNYANLYGIKYGILRYFNVIGADKSLRSGNVTKGNLFKELSKNIVKKNYTLNLYGNDYNTIDGTCVRDYIDVNDLCDLHYKSFNYIKKHKSLIINCGYGRGLSVLDIINNFSKVINKKIKIIYRPRRVGDAEQIFSDTKKLKITFPSWKRKYELISSIKSSLNWEKNVQKKNK